MINKQRTNLVVALLSILMCRSLAAQNHNPDSHRNHGALTQHTQPHLDPGLPEDMSLDDLFDFAEKPVPANWPQPVHDNPIYAFTLIELFEYRFSNESRDAMGWDAQGWIGNDDHKFWWKSEGEAVFDGAEEGAADLQALYAIPISAFWYLQVGVRYEQAWEPGNTDERFSAALGVQGIAPFKFDVEPTIFLTDDGDVIAQLTTSYDLFLTQRLVLQPRLELGASAQDIPESGLGAGVHGVDLDLRLRYHISRELAPYLGVRYSKLFGETADIATRNGSEDHDLFFILGVRLAF